MYYILEKITATVIKCLNLRTGEIVGRKFPKDVEDDSVVAKNGKSIAFEVVEAINIVRNFSKSNFSEKELATFSDEEIEELANRDDSHDFLVENKAKTSFFIEKNWNEVPLEGSIVRVGKSYFKLEDNKVYNKKLGPAAKYLSGKTLTMAEFNKLKPRKPFAMNIRKEAIKADVGNRFAIATDSLDKNGQSAQLAAGAKASDEDIALGHIFKLNNEEGRRAILKFDDYSLMQTCLRINGYLPEGRKEYKGDWVHESYYNYLMDLHTQAKKEQSMQYDSKIGAMVTSNGNYAATLLALEEELLRTDRPTEIATIRMKINQIKYGDEGWSDPSRKSLRKSQFEETDKGGIITNEIKFDFVKLAEEPTIKQRENLQSRWDIFLPNENRDFTMLKSLNPMVIGGKHWDIPVEVLREYAKYENDNHENVIKSTERNYKIEDAVVNIEA